MKVNLSLRRKLLLVPLLCSGIFIMAATILRAVYSLTDITKLPIAAAWASRETFVAAVAVSIPGIKPLFSNSKWVKSLKTGDVYGSFNKKSGDKSGTGGWTASFRSKPTNQFEMGSGRAWDISTKNKGERLPDHDGDGGSEEFIIQKDGQERASHSAYPDTHAITITRETILERT
ncbi:hypothetical protein SLS62_005963 [Diatrype stigma]|uniref:Uncharacterized protein n=1 Tax=Diatrype stigma TaxID=117547 RepID=A0AAN9YPC1_9PEZI